MRPSFQTVCLVFGVTLVHLLVISAFSPVNHEPATPRPQIVLAPELQSLLEADAARLAAEEASETVKNAAVEAAEESMAAGAEEANAAVPAALPLEDPVARPAPKLAEREKSSAPDPTGEEPARRRPSSAIREIRAISPVPRS